MLKLRKNMYIIKQSLYLDDTLIISDVHMGYEEALNMEGILVPRLQFKEIIDNLDSIFEEIGKKKVSKVIINGDLKHEFGKISKTEWRHTLKFLDYLRRKAEKIVLVKGNHDKVLEPIAKKRGIEIVEYEKIGRCLILHGDVVPEDIDKKTETIIIGHEHPAVSIKDGPRVERFKCFLKGRWERNELIVLPSFTPVIEGTDILREKLLSPFLRKIDEFRVYVVSDKEYDFGKVKNLR